MQSGGLMRMSRAGAHDVVMPSAQGLRVMHPETVDALRPASSDGIEGATPLVLAPITVRHEVPVRTVVTVVAVLAGLWLLAQLWTLLLSLFIALLLTAALDPPVTRLERRGVPRAVSIAIIILAVGGIVAGGVALVVPPLVEQGTQFADAFPGYLDSIKQVTQANPEI